MPCFPCQCGQLCSSLACRERLTPALVLAAVECALSDGRDVPGSAPKRGGRPVPFALDAGRAVGPVSCLPAPTLTLKDLLRFMMRSCFRHQRLADRETRGARREWRPWLDEIFTWYSLGDREALLGECAAAAEEFATLQRLAAAGHRDRQRGGDAGAARSPSLFTEQLRPAPRFEQRILALEENETLRPLVAAFRQSLQDIESLPPRPARRGATAGTATRWRRKALHGAGAARFRARDAKGIAAGSPPAPSASARALIAERSGQRESYARIRIQETLAVHDRPRRGAVAPRLPGERPRRRGRDRRGGHGLVGRDAGDRAGASAACCCGTRGRTISPPRATSRSTPRRETGFSGWTPMSVCGLKSTGASGG